VGLGQIIRICNAWHCPKNNLLVIPAKAELRRQDAEANIRAAVFNSGAGHGPNGMRQESHVIQFLLGFEIKTEQELDYQLHC
jgi:hypothetical protein